MDLIDSNLIQNLHPEIGSIVERVRFWTGFKYVNLDENLWTRVYLDLLSPCYTFDLSKVEKFKYVPVNTESRPGIEFVIVENIIWPNTNLLLHTRFDQPDAKQLNGFLPLPFSDKIKKAHKVELRKKIIKRESTRKLPCVKHEHKTCQSTKSPVFLSPAIDKNKKVIARLKKKL